MGETIATGLEEGLAGDQLAKTLGELLALVAAQTHLAYQLLVTGGAVGLTFDVPQNGLIIKHGNGFRRSSWRAVIPQPYSVTDCIRAEENSL